MYLLDVLHHFSSYFDVYTDTHRHHLQKILQTILIYRKGGMTSHSKQQIFICTWYVYIYIYTPKYHVDFLNSSPYIINYIYIYHIYIYVYIYEYAWHFRPSPECPLVYFLEVSELSRQRTWWKPSRPPMPMRRSWIILWWLSRVWKVPVVILKWCNLEVEQISENRSCHFRNQPTSPNRKFTSSKRSIHIQPPI